MGSAPIDCRNEQRRRALLERRDRFNGVDYVEVLEDQQTLCVHFFGDPPAVFDAKHPDGLKPENFVIEGGRRIRDIKVLALKHDDSEDPERDDCLRVILDKTGDFSTYRLCVVDTPPNTPPSTPPSTPQDAPGRVARESFDPRYACADFSFRLSCPSELDCKPETACPASEPSAADINYLAKDYASFRQLMLDRLALNMPEWRERHTADVGIAVVEVLAYAADHLSYYQDAVATEAYLATARQRISVRRHARLVDYMLHEGLNARAWLSVTVSSDSPPVDATDCCFITRPAALALPEGRALESAELAGLAVSQYEVFEPLCAPTAALQFFAARNEISFYTWGNSECCLPKGSTRATLLDEAPPMTQRSSSAAGAPATPVLSHVVGELAEAASSAVDRQRQLKLKVGDVLVFEEVLGPRTGNPADVDPTHRHAVRLTAVHETQDALFGGRLLLEVEWSAQDALPFALCLSARLPAPDCRWVDQVSVARGNIVLVDHGRTVTNESLPSVPSVQIAGECGCEGSLIETTLRAGRYAPVLSYAGITFSDPAPGPAPAPASSAFKRDARRATAQARLTEVDARVGTAGGERARSGPWARPGSPQWTAALHLLDSSATDQHFVAEIDDDGWAHLRFGDGELGRAPAPGTTFRADYRVGNAAAGNVGADAIARLVLRKAKWDGIDVRVRNPMPAAGGLAAEPVAEAKLLAPQAFRKQLKRAITASDYAALAAQHAGVQGAAARLRWTGSWYEARVGLDPADTEVLEPKLQASVEHQLERFRRIGHDLQVVQARYVPLDLALRVCVLPQYTRGEIEGALLELFSSRRLPGGRLGFFHPDRLHFGDSIYLSQLVAIAHAVEGVESVQVIRLQRLDERANGELEAGLLAVAATELAQLDNDPSFPERGRLSLELGGGR